MSFVLRGSSDDRSDDYQKMSPSSKSSTLQDTERFPVDQEGGSNGVAATALAIISCIMGGGIVSIPYAYAVEGILVGISVQITVIAAIFISCILYLRTRTILNCKTEFGEIAEKCLGPISGIILNSLLVFCIFGIMALYMTLFSMIFISLLGSGNDVAESILDYESFYIISLAVLIAPIVTRKKIASLKITTYILFFGVISLVALLSVLLMKDGSYEQRIANGSIEPSVYAGAHVKDETSVFEGVMDSVNIAVASQGFVIALFPIYSSMASSAKPRVMASVTAALLFTMTTYTYLSCVSIAVYGQENIQPSIFDNIKTDDSIASIALRCLFLTIFFCNIPFVFFAGKIALTAVAFQCFYKKKESNADEVVNSARALNDDSDYVSATKINEPIQEDI